MPCRCRLFARDLPLAILLLAVIAACLAGPAAAQSGAGRGPPPPASGDADELRRLDAEIAALSAAGRHAEAEAPAHRFIAIVAARDGEDTPNHASALDRLARLLNAQRRFPEAEAIYRRMVAIRERRHGREHLLTAADLFSLGVMLYRAGRTAEAEPLLRRVLQVRERELPADHADLGEILNWLGFLFDKTERAAEAEPLFRRALAIHDRRFGRSHPRTIESIERLAPLLLNHRAAYAEAADLYARLVAHLEQASPPRPAELAGAVQGLGNARHQQSRLTEAERHYRRALGLREAENGPDHPETLAVVGDLAVVIAQQSRLDEAAPLYARVLAGRERALGPDHIDVARAASNFALLRRQQGRFQEALDMTRRALDVCLRHRGAEHLDCLVMQFNVGLLLVDLARFQEAEPAIKATLVVRERRLGPGHPDVAASLSLLAGLYADLGRLAEAEPLYRRALAIREASLGRRHVDYSTALNALAIVLKDTGRLDEAEPLYKQAIAIRTEIFGADHIETALVLNNLALLHERQGRHAESRPLLERALAIRERTHGRRHPDFAAASNNLAIHHLGLGQLAEAERYQRQALAARLEVLPAGHPLIASDQQNLGVIAFERGHYGEAEQLFGKALALRQASLGHDHPDTARSLGMRGRTLRRLERWPEAWRDLEATAALFTRRALDNTSGAARDGKLLAHERLWLRDLIEAALAMAYLDPPRRADYEAKAFEAVQWVSQTDAATALRRLSARLAAGTDELARLVRERQDLLGALEQTDQRLLAALSSDRRDAAAIERLQKQSGGMRQREAVLEARLQKEFPAFATLMSPRPMPLAEAKRLLRPGEAAVITHTDDRYTYVFVVNGDVLAWHRAEIGLAKLEEHVMALRCGLDATAWHGVGRERCGKALGLAYGTDDERAGRPLPFDLARAHDLYRLLLGPVAAFVEDRSLLLVTPGPLARLPLGVLVEQPVTAAIPKAGDGYLAARWLGRSRPVAVLPSIASLAALRGLEGAARAPEPFIGFGDPVLTGACPRIRVPEHCPDGPRPVAGLAVRALGAGRTRGMVQGGLADVEALRNLCPLADTAHELGCVARSLRAPAASIRLGPAATETAVKRLPLERYRVVHFATHGVLASEAADVLGAAAEPALVLTPPATGTAEDDGLLTASEIAALKLNADWIVLSACNTAAGDGRNSEALAGLARAFFYAGARALLASHWAVYSEAAVRLVTRAFAEMEGDPRAGRAEAMRRAIAATIEQGGLAAHPAYWAPFVVVGEGARARQ